MKHFTPLRSTRVTILFAFPLLFLPLAQAQQVVKEVTTQSHWDKLQQANSRITASHVVWKRIERIHPIAGADPDKWAAQALASAREQGLTEQQAQQQAQVERREAARSKQGRVINSILDFTRIGTSVLCRIEHPDPEYRSAAIEFSDSINALFASTQVKGQEVPKDGNLTRDPEEVLSHSAAGYQVARVLLGIPLDQDFSAANPALSAKNSALKVLPNGDVSIEREARIEKKHSQNPDAITLAKDKFYPISAESFSIGLVINGNAKVITMKRSKSQVHVLASGHKQYPGGIWFPSRVTVTTPGATTDYALVSAKFNDQVDPAGLRLPPNLRVADARFGYGSNLAIYKAKDGKLPSDEQVKVQLQMDKQATQAKKVSKETTTNTKLSASPFGSVAGLGFIALGGLMLLKGRRKDS